MKPTTPGATRFIQQLLDHADRNEGALPGQITLTGYSVKQQQDVGAQLQRGHWVRAGKTIRVNLDKWANHAHAGDKKALLASLYQAAGRVPDNTKAKGRQEQADLAGAIRDIGIGYLPTVEQLSNDAASGRGWVGGSLRHDGPQKTLQRVEAFLRLTSGLPCKEELPLRSYCSRMLANSHALDDDGILRGALQRFVLERWPNHDEEENAWMEAGILIGTARGLVQAYGTLTLAKGDARLDLGALAKVGAGAALERRFIEDADIVIPPATATFIENPSTFTELRTKIPESHLIVLTDGFPSKATRTLAQRLVKAGVPVRHWGDIDPEGFRILEQLGPGVKPMLMGADTVNKVSAVTPFGDKAESFQLRLRRVIQPHERAALEACLARGGWVEQESIEIRGPLSGDLPAKLTAGQSSNGLG